MLECFGTLHRKQTSKSRGDTRPALHRDLPTTMTNVRIAGIAGAAALIIVAIAVGYRAIDSDTDSTAATSPTAEGSIATAAAHPSFLYGRVTTLAGAVYEGRLRMGGDQEAFWDDLFNGQKKDNQWVAYLPPEQHPKERRTIEILGVELWDQEKEIDFGRPFVVRFGDITRIDASGTDVRVTLKSGTVAVLDRLDASDFDDGVRVWDVKRGVVDLDSRWIRSIELLPPVRPDDTAPHRLHGDVRTADGIFSGFLQWNREEGLDSDELEGRAADRELSLRFDAIRSIARDSGEGSRVTLHDGREIVLSGSREAGPQNRGIYVDDLRYGRVLIPWDRVERVDFGRIGTGPTYEDFPPGEALTGTVMTRDGRSFAGRVVLDLDESETIESLDAPSHGVDYTIPFGLIARIDPFAGEEESGGPVATVTLHHGEELQLERKGDLAEENGGMLIFIDGQDAPQYVPWTDVERLELDPPAAMYPPIAGAG